MLKNINTRLRWLSAGVYLAIAFIAWLESDEPKKEAKEKESILDSWFLVDFADDSIISWGSKKDMIQLLNESYGGLTLVTYSNLTLKMKESISLYTNGTLSYKHTH